MLEGISKKRVLVNVAGGLVARIVNITFVFWMYQYLLKRIPADEFAIYPVLIVIMMTVPLFASFFASAVSRSVIEAYAAGRPRDVRVLHATTVIGLSVFLAVLLAAGILGAVFVDRILTIPPDLVDDARLMVVVLVADLCLALFAVPFTIAFEVRQRFVRRDAIMVSAEFLKIALTFCLIVLVEPRVAFVVVASFAANAVAVATYVVFARRLLPEFRIDRRLFDFGVLRSVVSFGVWTSLGQMSILVYQNAGPILLNLWSTPVQVTAYFIGSVFDRRIGSTMSIALAPLQPVLTTMSVTGDFRRLGNTYMRGGRYALWAAMAIATPLAVYAEPFVLLYVGPEYRDAAAVMVLMIAPFPLTYASIMLSRIAIATGRVRAFFTGAIATSLAGLLLMLVAVGPLGLGSIGAAAAIAVVMAISHLAFFWPLGLRLAGISLSEFAARTLGPGLMPSAAGLVAWGSLRLAVAPDGWLELLACGAAGGIVYLATLAIGCLQPDERDGLARVLARFHPGAVRSAGTR